MGKVYRYRAHVRWAQYFFPALLGIVLGLLGVTAWRLHLKTPLTAGMGLFLAVAVTVLIVEFSLGWLVFYRLAGVSIELEDEALIYRTRRGILRLPFDQMLPLQFATLRYVGGWLKVRTEDRTVRITVVVDGISELVHELQAALDTHGRSDCYDSTRLFRFLKTAAFSDDSWDRAYAIFW